MIKELSLSAEEIYYLGKLIDGQYLNYRYIAAMSDIQQKNAAYIQRCRNNLCEKEVLFENLWGDVSVNQEVKEFISPLYFGDFEASVEEIYIEDKTYIQSAYFHRKGEECLFSLLSDKQVKLQKISDEQLTQFIVSLMPENYNNRMKPQAEEMDDLKVHRIIIMKNNDLIKGSTVKVFYDCNGLLCEEQEDKSYKVLSPKQFYDKAIVSLKGGI